MTSMTSPETEDLSVEKLLTDQLIFSLVTTHFDILKRQDCIISKRGPDSQCSLQARKRLPD